MRTYKKFFVGCSLGTVLLVGPALGTASADQSSPAPTTPPTEALSETPPTPVAEPVQAAPVFEASVEPWARVFFNYNYQLARDVAGAADKRHPNSFEATRTYVGLNAELHQQLAAAIVLDAGRIKPLKEVSLDSTAMELSSKSDSRFVVFVKKAKLDIRDLPAKHKVSLGIIGTPWIDFVDKVWGHRYIDKSLTDRRGLLSSADLGVSISGKPAALVNYEIAVVNGEGYDKVSEGKEKQVAGRLTLMPLANGSAAVKGLSVSLQGALEPMPGDDLWVAGGLLHYTQARVRAGLELARGRERKHRAMENAASLFATVFPVADFKGKVVARVDAVDPDADPDTDNVQLYAIAGLGYEFKKYVDTTIDVRVADDAGTDTRSWTATWDWQFELR